ncbi:MAG: hypothetical protein H6Q89_1312 [Myxococcaceae bacterium]|nr:hypothetical protein [Myxococcaceae bacterium]
MGRGAYSPWDLRSEWGQIRTDDCPATLYDPLFMSAVLQEWLNLLVRWIHVIAAIMWVGDSFLFMWLDSHIGPASKKRDDGAAGELWMTHSGAFYEVVKRKSLSELPPTLYWFKWESYATWITGVMLLTIVYYLGGAAFLIDKAVADLPYWQAVAISAGLLPVSFLVYDTLWRTPLAKDQRVFAAVWFGLLVALAYGLTHLFSGRAAFLHLGAVMGTVMTFNVFFRIIPSQRHMIAATQAGTPVDTSYGVRAKGRSVHNHYMTLPVLFTMLSNHFPSTYSHPQAWLVFALIAIVGVTLKYVMNFRRQSHPALVATLVAALGAVAFLTQPEGPSGELMAKYREGPKVSYATVNAILQTRCTSCHSANPSSELFAAAPSGVLLDSPDRVHAHAERMFMRAVQKQTMPLANLTQMTIAERELVGAWFAQGADVNAPGPAVLPGKVKLAAAQAPLPASEAARQQFATVCAACHGEKGAGDGLAASALPTRPRNFTETAWQTTVTDEHLKTIILKGGPAVGKSPLMPANPGLEDQPEVVAELVKLVRGFEKK